MRKFTQEEKELIINTPITKQCFDMGDFNDVDIFEYGDYKFSDIWADIIHLCEVLRNNYNKTKDEQYFIELIRLLPNSYKVINLVGTPDLEKLTNGMIQRTI